MPLIEIDLDASSKRDLREMRERQGPKEFVATLLKLFDRLAQLAAGFVVSTQLSGQVLKRRTGQLARSVTGQAFLREGVPAFRVGVFRGPALKYARAQEAGATILPVKARALAMPVDDGVTPAGVARYASPREAGDLVFVPYRGRNAIGGLYDRQSLRAANGDLRQASRLYVLLKRVDIPAHHFLLNGVRSFIPKIVPELTKVLKDFLRVRPETRR